MVWNPVYGSSLLSGIEEWFTDRLKSNNKVLVNEDCPKSSGVHWLQSLKIDGFDLCVSYLLL